MPQRLIATAAVIFSSAAIAAGSLDFNEVARRCAPLIPLDTMRAVALVESGLNPYAVGVAGGGVKQPTSLEEALALTASLEEAGRDYSAGIAQINRRNFEALGLTRETVFEPCANLAAASRVLAECYARTPEDAGRRERLRAALTCYNSGKTADAASSYASRVERASGAVPSVRDAVSDPVTGGKGLVF